jgi:cell division protease FtsH
MELRRFFRAPLLLIAVAVLLLLFVLDYANSGSTYQQVDTSQVVQLIEQGKVNSALIVDKNQTIQITTKDGKNLEASWVSGQGLQLQNELQKAYDAGKLPKGYNVNIPKSNALLDLIPTALIYLVIFLVFFFMLSQMQGGGSRVMNFGKSRAKLITKDTPKTTFADVAGADEAIEELQEIKEFLQSPAKFQAIGAKIPKGVLLYGPPGTGKTLLARAVAGEAGVPFYSISGSDFVEMFVGVGASRVRDLFEQAKANAPAIVFVDEIDAVGRHRGAGLGGGHDEREQTLNQMLVELDGFDTKGGVIVIAATNRPDILDPALLRPGRFDRQIVVAQPDLVGRKGILRVHARGKPIAPDADLDIIARRTPGFTGADLANVINEGALLTARTNGKQISMAALEEAIDRVLAGPERKSVLLSERERKVIAYHEGGHALVGHAMPHADPVHKVTIIPRGRALGYTSALPTEDKFLVTRAEMLDQLAMLLGGRTAEELIFHEPTTGAANDIEKATQIARGMVTEYGMSERLATCRTVGTTPRRSPPPSTRRSAASSSPRTTRPGKSSSSTGTCSTAWCSGCWTRRPYPGPRSWRSSRPCRSARLAAPTPVTASGCPRTAPRCCRPRNSPWPRPTAVTAWRCPPTASPMASARVSRRCRSTTSLVAATDDARDNPGRRRRRVGPGRRA